MTTPNTEQAATFHTDLMALLGPKKMHPHLQGASLVVVRDEDHSAVFALTPSLVGGTPGLGLNLSPELVADERDEVVKLGIAASEIFATMLGLGTGMTPVEEGIAASFEGVNDHWLAENREALASTLGEEYHPHVIDGEGIVFFNSDHQPVARLLLVGGDELAVETNNGSGLSEEAMSDLAVRVKDFGLKLTALLGYTGVETEMVKAKAAA